MDINNYNKSPIISKFNMIIRIRNCSDYNLLQLLPIELIHFIIEEMHLIQCNSIMSILKSL